MSSQRQNNRSITREEMCVIVRRTDGALQTVFHPISYDYQLLARLQDLSRRMKLQEASLEKELVDSTSPLLIKFEGSAVTTADSIASHFLNAARYVYRMMGLEEASATQYSVQAHDWWRGLYTSGIHLLPEYSAAIRGFAMTFDAVASCRPYLEEADYRWLEQAYLLANGMRPYLAAALEGYERAFSSYIEEVNLACPGLFKKKSFCRNFLEVWGKAELDYAVEPGNQCVVEDICQYYWAYVLEQLYGSYGNTNAVAYSHRRLGWIDSEQVIPIDTECDLHLLMKTNFGFGEKKYFGSTLRYGSVNAINAPFLMFFEGAGKVGLLDFTFGYEVEEESFETCFNDAVRLQSEFRRVGEERFVDRYFRKSLQDLSELLTIFANTNTFLRITTLSRFAVLTSGIRNPLVPDEGFSRIDFSLNDGERTLCDSLVAMILSVVKTGGAEGCANDQGIQALLERMFVPYRSSSLQLMVKKDLVRRRMAHGLASLSSHGVDVSELISGLVHPDEGIAVKTCRGYELISMRVDKALSAIGPIERLREIAALTRFESVIDSIVSTCLQIGEQAQSYITQSIDPELGRMVPECNRLKSQLDATNAEIDKARYRGIPVSAWLARQSQGLEAHIRSLNGTIAELEQQKRKLNDYIRTVNSIRTAG